MQYNVYSYIAIIMIVTYHLIHFINILLNKSFELHEINAVWIAQNKRNEPIISVGSDKKPGKRVKIKIVETRGYYKSAFKMSEWYAVSHSSKNVCNLVYSHLSDNVIVRDS